MADTYDIQTYLLDRANVHDTIFRMTLAFDNRTPSVLVDSVYTATVHIDYSSIMDKPAEDISSTSWAQSVDSMLSKYDSTQHTAIDLLIELPQPGTAPRPDTCSAIAYGNAWIYKRDAQGRPRAMVRRNGGRYEFELKRLSAAEAGGQNPWRISLQRVLLAFQDVGE
ncbi:hypothetical protein F4775DRAFT_598749 [Biscogniauxia sp. FL1348]|nr:hypothetical protein F4775DRAFT_598749 [Biscogniauxia sp. FL1348]